MEDFKIDFSDLENVINNLTSNHNKKMKKENTEKQQKEVFNKLNEIREIALKYSKLILEEAGISKENNPYYPFVYMKCNLKYIAN